MLYFRKGIHMSFELDILSIVILFATICITIGVYKNKSEAYDKKFRDVHDNLDKIEEKCDIQYEKAWNKIDKLTDVVYEVKNYIQLIATCFKMDIKDDKEDQRFMFIIYMYLLKITEQIL